MKCKKCGCDMAESEETNINEDEESNLKIGVLDELEDLMGGEMVKKLPKKDSSISIMIEKKKKPEDEDEMA